MTDTGQVPGEGQPEHAGGQAGQPATASPAAPGAAEQPGTAQADAYGHPEPSGVVVDDDDLLLMPAAQGAWTEQPDRRARPAAPAPQDRPAPARRPLHMGPPVPDATGGVVRSLADRGPATTPQPMPVRQPGPPTDGPEYLDVPAADVPATDVPQAGGGPQAPGEMPAPQAPAAETGSQVPGAEAGPQAQDPAAPAAPAAPVAPVAYGAPGAAQLPGPQLGEIPPQVMPWGEASAQAAAVPVAPVAEPQQPGAAPAPQPPAGPLSAEAVQAAAQNPDDVPAARNPDDVPAAQAPEAVPAEVHPEASGQAVEAVAEAEGSVPQQAAGPEGVARADASADAVAPQDAAAPEAAAAENAAEAVDAAVAQPEADAATPEAEQQAAEVDEASAADAPGVDVPNAAAPAVDVPQADAPTGAEAPGADGADGAVPVVAAQGSAGQPAAPEGSEEAPEAAADEPAEARAAEAGDVVTEEGVAQPAEAGAEQPEAQPQPRPVAVQSEAQSQPAAGQAPVAEVAETAEGVAPAQPAPAAGAEAAAQATAQAAAPEADAEAAAQVPVPDADAQASPAPEAGAQAPESEVQAQAAEAAAAQVTPVADAAAADPAAAQQPSDVPAAEPHPEAAAPQAGAQAEPPAEQPGHDQAAQEQPQQQAPQQPSAPADDSAPAPAPQPNGPDTAERTQPTEPPADAEPAAVPQAAPEATAPQAEPAAEAPAAPQAAPTVVPGGPVPAPLPATATPAAGTPIAGWPQTVPPAAPETVPHPQDGTGPGASEAPQGVPQGQAHPEAAPVTPEQPQPAEATDATAPADAVTEGPAHPEPASPEAPAAEATAPAEPDGATPAIEQTENTPVAPTHPPAAGYDDSERAAVHRVMRERRDIRNGFRPDPIPNDLLLRVLEAAHTAPSVGHSQPWDFVVIRSGETRERMHQLATGQRKAYAASLPKGRAKQFRELKIEAILDTPVNIVVTADPTRGGRHTLGRHTQPQMAPYSAALAVENLWLAARAEGLGVGWVSFFDERQMVTELGLPEHLEVVAYLCIGYVDEFPEEPELMQAGWAERRPLSWVVHEETYGRRALPGEDPHDLLRETLHGIRPLDAKALGEAWERQKRMTKPAGALGMLEIISAQLCGLSRKCPPPIPEPAAVAIFAGDHGVHAQGVTPWPQEVTGQMVANFLSGGAVCNAFATQVGAEVCVVDVGVAVELPAAPGLLPRKVRAGTDDFTAGPAMSQEDVLKAIEAGIETARDLVAAGNKALLTGEMGIANTTASAALVSVYTGADPAEITGRGTGINDETHARKVDVVRRALELHRPDPADPIGVLAAVGGLEHAALVGLILGGASLRTPVILDGVSAGAAALVARAIAPEALAACIAGHRSAEPGHVAALTKLGLRPLVDLDLRLGEGTGALLALPLVQSAARAMNEVATFDTAGVTEKD
ncbi:nicotinate-nucleotide--dimethylbenzimidazole phosphoribosyltransferase [Streptomyces sp. NPDC059080]|uniref:nicotinate-nucleotide--dimethylbenzimidazole phosphoribosyltransferase n=1 Tax=Streptomyces sp. NPDC059080 TaxID=3346718 RepID=UPI00367C73A9